MRLNPEKCAALFVDYQEKLMPAQYEKERCLKNASTLAKGLIALGIPIIASEQYKKGLGSTVEELAGIEGFPEGIDKTSFSCMLNEDLKSALLATGAKHIIVCGVETHICVLQTITDLVDMGMCVYFAEDCSTSRTKENHDIGTRRALQEGAFITCTETILFELLRAAGGDTFKYISNLIK